MIEIGISPVIFRLGPFALRWYSVMIILGILVALWWGLRGAKGAGITRDNVYNALYWGVPGGIIGSRLLHVLDQLDYYLVNPGKIIGGEGQAIFGAVLGGALAAWIGSKVHKYPYGKLLDLAAPGVLLAQAMGRVGNIINGDAIGKETTLPWGVVYTNPDSYAPLGIVTHPVVVYEILWDLVVFAIVVKLRGKIKPDGTLFLSYLALYSTGRFFINFFRESKAYFGGIHQAQLVALAVLIISVSLLVYRLRKASDQAADNIEV